MENRYGFIRKYRSEEFREEDVWDVIKDERESDSRKGERGGTRACLSVSRRLPSAARMIPVAGQKHQNHDKPKVMQNSAPVNIPEWPKMYERKSARRKNHDDAIHDHNHDDNEEDDDDDDDYCAYEDDDGKLPPHEWLARKTASSQIFSFSVCEGAGRKLKGRDLSRVRNAVLSKTGFI